MEKELTQGDNNFFNDNFILIQEDVDSFREKGFVHLKQFFSREAMNILNKKIEAHLVSPTDKYQTGFNRVKYDIFEDDDTVRKIFESNIFRSTIHDLAGRDMLHTQTLAFELKQKTSKGFP
ncbi:phytanoyl-CoA dioxygenase family protein, partial [Flagellimonas marinaquae]